MLHSKKVRASVWISLVALLSALTILMALLRLKILFPLLPFLTFRLDEIICVIAFLLLGLKAGLAVSFAEFLALNLGKPYHALVGPSMKFLALVSMILGLEFARRVKGIKELTRVNLMVLALFGMLFRVVVMSAATFILYYILFPSMYLPFAEKVILKVFGVEFSTGLELTMILIILTIIFNALHTVLSVIPAASIYKFCRKLVARSS